MDRKPKGYWILTNFLLLNLWRRFTVEKFFEAVKITLKHQSLPISKLFGNNALKRWMLCNNNLEYTILWFIKKIWNLKFTDMWRWRFLMLIEVNWHINAWVNFYFQNFETFLNYQFAYILIYNSSNACLLKINFIINNNNYNYFWS